MHATIYIFLGFFMTWWGKIKTHLSLNICNGLIFSMFEGKIVVFSNIESDNKNG
jgi:hypothetical protein